MISLLGGTALYAPDVSFSKNFFEGVAPPDSGYKKALPFGERCSLGYLVIWLLGGLDTLGLEFFEVILDKVD